MRHSIFLFFSILILFFATRQTIAQITPQEAIPNMMKGINLGNTLEPPNESGWNNGPVQEYYFDDYRDAGFTSVRIPVRWDEHTLKEPPYTITESWMNRVEQVVDWALSRGLFVTLNAHHEEWIKADYSDSNKARMDSIWIQISTRFKNKSEKLFFEMINEPKGLSTLQINDFNARILSIIRETNPTRIVIYSGNEWSGLNEMINAAIPNDDYLIAYYHSYDPWNFAGEAKGTWGSSSDINAIKSNFQKASTWSISNNMPVILSEFGAIKNCDYNSRMLHYATYVEQALKFNIPFQVWDDGGDFKVYEREQRTWNEIKNIVLHYSDKSPNSLKYTLDGDSLITISWQNRNSENMSTIVEKKINDSTFINIAELESSSSTFSDTAVSQNNKYYYRVRSQINDSTYYYSYPISVFVKPTARTSFLGTPCSIPGVIEAEHYDVGGEGLTYHDIDASNIPGGFRTEEGVDLEVRDSGGYQISYIKTGEWVEYTIDVEQDGEYDIITDVASLEGGGIINFSVGNGSSSTINIPSTNSWQTTTTVTGKISLEQGIQILRLSMVLANPFNVDKFELTLTPTDIENFNDTPNEFSLSQNYPNPFNPSTTIQFTLAKRDQVNIYIYSPSGELVENLMSEEMNAGKHEVSFNSNNLASGLYFYKIQTNNFTSVKKMILLK